MNHMTVNKCVLGIESCIKRLTTGVCPYTCPYRKKSSGFRNECLLKLLRGTLQILQEEQKKIIEENTESGEEENA